MERPLSTPPSHVEEAGGGEMRSLRRRVTLIFADCLLQSRMTVLRREGRSLESRIETALADLRKAAPRLLGAVLAPPAPSSFTFLRCFLGFDRERRPEKADQLASNRHHDLVVLLAACGHPPVTTT